MAAKPAQLRARVSTSPSDESLADGANCELAASPALRQERVTAVISHECKGQPWVVSISLCETVELFELILGQQQRVGEAAGNVTGRPRSGILHVLLTVVWTTDSEIWKGFFSLPLPLPSSFTIAPFV